MRHCLAVDVAKVHLAAMHQPELIGQQDPACGLDDDPALMEVFQALLAPAKQVADARPQVAVALPLRVQQFGGRWA